jgi:hypothetical protein
MCWIMLEIQKYYSRPSAQLSSIINMFYFNPLHVLTLLLSTGGTILKSSVNEFSFYIFY